MSVFPQRWEGMKASEVKDGPYRAVSNYGRDLGQMAQTLDGFHEVYYLPGHSVQLPWYRLFPAYQLSRFPVPHPPPEQCLS